MLTDPLICEVTRGTMVESRHRIHAMIRDASGIIQAWGDPDLVFYPRSAIKFLQALPLVESGAADAMHVSEPELALASASHSGSPEHVDAVGAWLGRLGLDADSLGCGAHLPYDEVAAHALIRSDTAPTRLNNNCSGKHTGFLATAMHLAEPLDGYLQADHPVQRRLYDILVDFGGQDLAGGGRGIDGCGIPVYGMTLLALASAVQKMAAPSGVTEARGKAIRRVLNAVTAHSFMVGGRGRFDTDVMRVLGGRVATKGGAEGVHVAMIPEKGIGVALKVEDGEKRAGDVALGWILDRLGMFDDAQRRGLASHLRPQLTNAAGHPAGLIRIAEPN